MTRFFQVGIQDKSGQFYLTPRDADKLIRSEKIARASGILGLVSLAMPWSYANSPALRVTGWLFFYHQST